MIRPEMDLNRIFGVPAEVVGCRDDSVTSGDAEKTNLKPIRVQKWKFSEKKSTNKN
jgi:hypothetical protein